ncbi:hypothetical protein FBU30_001119 [Linnemannia zychae]|nr:hypothetical protein FBU30_001119 [Linnemannia zychae]
MLQRVNAIKPVRLASTISRFATYEARAYSTSGDDSAKVSAIYKRLGFDLSDPSLMTQSITHKSYAHGSLPTNERLGYIGRTFLQMHLAEQKWDKVKSNRTLRASVAHVMTAEKLAKIARSMGVNEVLRWKAASSSANAKVGEDTVLAHTLEAMLGAVYHDKGSKAAKEFVSKHIYTY